MPVATPGFPFSRVQYPPKVPPAVLFSPHYFPVLLKVFMSRKLFGTHSKKKQSTVYILFLKNIKEGTEADKYFSHSIFSPVLEEGKASREISERGEKVCPRPPLRKTETDVTVVLPLALFPLLSFLSPPTQPTNQPRSVGGRDGRKRLLTLRRELRPLLAAGIKKGGNMNVAMASSCTDSWSCLLRPSAIKEISSPNHFLHTAHTPSPFPASFLISLDTVSLPPPPSTVSTTARFRNPSSLPVATSEGAPVSPPPTLLSARNGKSLRESKKSVEGRQQLEDGRTGGLFL